MSSFSNFVPLYESWLETFHINKYVKKYDGRITNRPIMAGKIPSFVEARDRAYKIRNIRYKKLLTPVD